MGASTLAVYRAVYVVGPDGAVMLCEAAPPSDHDANWYEVPLTDCVGGALIELSELTITVRVNGATELELPTVSVSPVGSLAKVRSTVFGSSRTLVVPDWPDEFVAVNWSSSHEG